MTMMPRPALLPLPPVLFLILVRECTPLAIFPRIGGTMMTSYSSSSSRGGGSVLRSYSPPGKKTTTTTTTTSTSSSPEDIFEEFASFLLEFQNQMINELERNDDSGMIFTRDGWGAYATNNDNGTGGGGTGGITRVLQGGNVIEKGACSLTIIRDGILTSERANAIRGRRRDQRNDEDDVAIAEGDAYSAAALSVVLHTRNPHVPTFRSDVRIFLVSTARGREGNDDNDDDGGGGVARRTTSDGGTSVAWFGGGSDLTPYYVVDRDVIEFHSHLKDMCDEHFPHNEGVDDDEDEGGDDVVPSYRTMKRSCDEYFYLPARAEHRGTGGIFFDDLPATLASASFVTDVARGWMPSWLPIVNRNRDVVYTPDQRHWQCLRRGRYLEFNLLYDRGVRFGLANVNPRVEGVMVSAPPMIAYDYNHVPCPGSEEERLVDILKTPRDWV